MSRRTPGFWIEDPGCNGECSLYATPAIAGVVLMFFMVKPILARPPARQEPLPIDAEAEPILFAFIDEICRQVRAPRPRRVQVDCTVNASAGLMRGPFNVLRGDLVLTIGLPLVAGLSIRELAGVLAHEFGHFAQGGGLRLTATVRGVNAWFGRVVYERDEWDVTVGAMVERGRLASGGRRSHRARGCLGVAPGAHRPDARWTRRQLLHDAADGIRRRQL